MRKKRAYILAESNVLDINIFSMASLIYHERMLENELNKKFTEQLEVKKDTSITLGMGDSLVVPCQDGKAFDVYTVITVLR